MRQLPLPRKDRNLLVGTATADDAGVYRLDATRALVQTADFFTPIVDDPFTFGEIAAANALSDVYAMGGRPLTALNLLGLPPERVPPKTIATILRGGLSKAEEARCAVLGGHTVRMPELFYGMAVTGIVAPRRILANTGARPGDWLVLTKPLGLGIIATGIKLGSASRQIQQAAVRIMRHLNRVGALLAEKNLVRAGTDITGFGFLGHLRNICRGSQVCAEIHPEAVPAIGKEVFALMKRDCIPGGTKQNLLAAANYTQWRRATEEQKVLLTDAQTSGGLLLCVPPTKLNRVLHLLEKAHSPCAEVVGQITSCSLTPSSQRLLTV